MNLIIIIYISEGLQSFTEVGGRMYIDDDATPYLVVFLTFKLLIYC